MGIGVRLKENERGMCVCGGVCVCVCVCANFIYRNRSNARQWKRENFINK